VNEYIVWYYDQPYSWVAIRADVYKPNPNPVRLICRWQGFAESESQAIWKAKAAARARFPETKEKT